ncbi:MAG: leucyl/phenylalanyl-tRNA--protein transferase [Lentisphaeria bacterium]|nr:leucyl/phenylalanyl-tRNA--protein transferase [Lentisphaeria bacterium]
MDWNDSVFSPPESSDPYGYVGWSYDIDTAMLEDAYRHGVFPWPEGEKEILWFSPPERGGVETGKFHIPHGTERELKKKKWHLEIDTVFDQVIDECAASFRPGQPGTWITSAMRRGYKEFHRAGWAHSFETFDEENNLVGGLYGVLVGAVFCGESMFFKESGASKFALANMFSVLRDSGVEFVDTQMITPTLAMFGAVEISRSDYWKKLCSLRDRDIKIKNT